MSNNMTPEKFLESYVDYFNTGNISSILALYESDASFALQPGKVVKGKDSIRSSLQTFIEMKGKLGY
jgi:ketosteroid isomerase-like protein